MKIQFVTADAACFVCVTSIFGKLGLLRNIWEIEALWRGYR